MPKMKLSCCDQSNYMCAVTKTRQDNNVTDRIGLVYVGNDTKLSRPSWLSVICDKN